MRKFGIRDAFSRDVLIVFKRRKRTTALYLNKCFVESKLSRAALIARLSGWKTTMTCTICVLNRMKPAICLSVVNTGMRGANGKEDLGH